MSAVAVAVPVIDDVLVVRNLHGGPAVFTDTDAQRTPYEWQGAGDPNGGDVIELPIHIAKNPNFRKAVARGKFEIMDGDQDVIDAIERAGAKWQANQAQKASNIEDQMSRETRNDMIIKACQGPGPRGSLCGASVYTRESQAGKFPDLCDSHKHLSNQFVLEETDEIKNGSAVQHWIRADAHNNNPSY